MVLETGGFGQFRYGFSDKYTDQESDLCYFGARYRFCDGKGDRWISAEPMIAGDVEQAVRHSLSADAGRRGVVHYDGIVSVAPSEKSGVVYRMSWGSSSQETASALSSLGDRPGNKGAEISVPLTGLPLLYNFAHSNPLRFFEFSGLSPQDIAVIKQAFGQYIDQAVKAGERLPGQGVVAGAINNLAASATFAARQAGLNVTQVEGCAGQCQSLQGQLSGLQSSGKISEDFSFFQKSEMAIPGFEHNVIEAISPKDNTIMRLDPWKGTIEQSPIYNQTSQPSAASSPP
ncbi:MAG: hypothetical protein IT285_13870 [Bdellovibrionales bacterium]|nr:hypothetical protein [Bdellovibrionales bacterium]